MKQIDLNIYKGTRGGRRPGSGRKRIHSPGVEHKERVKITRLTPLHINFKYNTHIRHEGMILILEKACLNASHFGLKITHYSIQTNHIHIICETRSTADLISGMRSLTNTIVKLLGKGSIQVERYHLHILRTKAEIENAVSYVIFNDLKHSGKLPDRYTKGLFVPDSWLLKQVQIPPNLRPKYK